MSGRFGIFVGIAAGIAGFACKGSDPTPSKSAPEGSAAVAPGSAATGSASRSGTINPPAVERPTKTPEPPPPPSGTPFANQDRDPDWAPKAEAEIKRRFSVGVRAGHLDATECRADQCLLTMSGSEADMTTALADLESEGGLRGYADHIVLAGNESRDGKLVIRAYAVFDRKASDDTN